jgi:hypothetical protein
VRVYAGRKASSDTQSHALDNVLLATDRSHIAPTARIASKSVA